MAYLLGEFPSRTETFIAHEVHEMSAHFDLVVFALSGERTAPGDVPVIRLPQRFSWRLGISHLSYLVRHPWRYVHSVKECLKKPGRIRRLKAFYKSIYFERHLKPYNITHLHAHFATAPTDAAVELARLTGLPYSFSAHAHDIYVHNPSLPEKIIGAAFVITCTHHNKTQLDRLVDEGTRAKIFTVYHGIPLDKWPFQACRRNANELPKIVSVGRLVEKKGFRYLAEALRILHKQGYAFRWDIIGEGPERSALSQLSETYQLTDHIHFRGWQSPEEIRQRFSRNCILIQPSVVAANGDQDGIPNVILEAMASGVPVIATSMPSIIEVLAPDKGLLVPLKDPEAIAQAILTLCLDQELKEQMTRHARTYMETLDVTVQARTLANIVEATIQAYP